MYRKVIAPVVACLLLALLGWLVFRVVKPFLVAIGWATTITVITYPLYERLLRRLKGREKTASVLMVLGVLVVMVVPTVMLTTSLSRQAAELFPHIEEIATRQNPVQAVRDKLESYRGQPVLGTLAGWVQDLLPAPEELGTTFPDEMKSVIGGITGMLTTLLSNALTFLINLFLTLLALYIFYTRGSDLLGEVVVLAPLPADRARDLMERFGAVIRAVFKGVVLTAMIQGILGGIGWWITGLPSPLLFGALMAVASMVPYIGTTMVWLPGGLYLILAGQTGYGIGLILWGAVVVGSSDNILRPLLSGPDAGISTPLMLVGIVGGLLTFGLSGLVLGPLVLATMLFLLEEYHREVPEPETSPPPIP